MARSKQTTEGAGAAVAKPAARKKTHRKRKRAREEYVFYLIRVAEWDYHYGFRPSDPKSPWDHGPYSELSTLTFAGELTEPENNKYRKASVTLSAREKMMEERRTGPPTSIGSLSAYQEELSAYIFVPAERLAELVSVAQSGRVQSIHMTGTKLRYRSGLVLNLSLDTKSEEEEEEEDS